MIDALTDPFAGGIAQRALLEMFLLGVVCGPLGAWIVLYRQSYAAESIAHAALPGLVLASLAGLPLVLGAAGGLAAAGVAIAMAGRTRGVGSDSATAVVVTTMFGAGVLLALSPDAPARLGEILFGDPLGISATDLIATAVLALAVAISLTALGRRFSLVAFDPQAATALGASPGRTELALLALLALTTLVAVQALGNLLVVALLIAPGAAALRLASRLPAVLALSAGLAIAAGVAGLYASHYLETAAGASIALAAVGVFAMSIPLGAVR